MIGFHLCSLLPVLTARSCSGAERALAVDDALAFDRNSRSARLPIARAAPDVLFPGIFNTGMNALDVPRHIQLIGKSIITASAYLLAVWRDE
jgi:hypothetical protein